MRVPDFSSLSVLVVGDLIADHWLYASPRRLSREAPVMVLRHERERMGAGGAANVARNLRSLGADVSVLGAIGKDAAARELLTQLEDEGIDTSGVELVPGATTPTKTRILAAEPRRSLQQILRIDRDPVAPLPAEIRARVAARAFALGQHADAIVVSDYEYGCASREVGAAASELAANGRIVVLDPRSSIEGYEGLTALTPNIGEVSHLTRDASFVPEGLDDPAALRIAARELIRRAACRYLLVTRGNLGMALFGSQDDGIPEEGVAVAASGSGEVTDVCGAGDTAASVFALALAAGAEPAEAMVLANAASGVVVMEHGAAVCRPPQLSEALVTAPPAVRFAAQAP
ncbi:MAG: bifunctional heptose 7-phosphate kinase/heptose 1-phosphate adenyltransferase [Planctomycetota bacterium]